MLLTIKTALGYLSAQPGGFTYRDTIGVHEQFEVDGVVLPVDPPDPPDPPDPSHDVPIIAFDDVIVVGSDRDVFGYPEAAVLGVFNLRDGEMEIQTSGTDAWPTVRVGADDVHPAQAATLWIFLRIAGQWYATGAERLRPEQLHGGKPEGDARTLVGSDWLYDPNRWGPMAGYNPAPGEWVGVMVVAGSTRSDHQVPVQARTNVLMYRWPDEGNP